MRKYTIILITIFAVALMSTAAMAKTIRIGDILPDYEMKDLNGKAVKVSDFRGQYVVYDVWATWCKYCIPVLEDYQKNLQTMEEAGVKVVAISVDTKVETITNFLKEKDWTFTITHDKTNNAARLWGATGIPAVFMVDPEGQVIYTHVGMNTFSAFWADAQKAIELSKNPPTLVSSLQDGTYKGAITQIADIYMDENLELEIAPGAFSTTAPKLKKQPVYENRARYAALKIGGQVITVAAVRSKDGKIEDTLYIDYDANLDLTGEGEMQMMETGTDPNTGAPASRWIGEVRVTLEKGVTMGYQLLVFFGADYAEYYVIPLEGYQAEVKVTSGVVKAWIIDLNANGKFNDEGDLFWLDLNQNGLIDSVGGAEIIPAKQVLNLAQGKYQIKIAENGKEISIKTVK